jgi:hypothetical protein
MTESLVPAGKRSTDLTVAELAYASRKLRVDVLSALVPRENGDGHPERAMALAYVALLWKRRIDPACKIEEFTGLEFSELMALLATDDETTEDDGPEMESLAEEIAANPTVSVPA